MHLVPASSTTDNRSLRERKRVQTWTALHRAAVELALEYDTLNEVTVEAIANQADVSPRTFFNYFGSKEDAVLGVRAPVIDEQTRADFTLADDQDLIEEVTTLLVGIGRATMMDALSRQERAELLKRHPLLMRNHINHVTQMEQFAETLVSEQLANRAESDTPSSFVTSSFVTEDVARLSVLVSGSIMRFVARRMLADPTESEDDVLAYARRLFKAVTGTD